MHNKSGNDKKLNNAGFTLLEVLVAMTVLAIASIPLLRSFYSAARANFDSRIQSEATAASEILMEDSKYLTLEDLFAKYYGPNTDSDGDGVKDKYVLQDSDKYADPSPSGTLDEYKLVISDASLINSKAIGLRDGYYAQVIFDPNKYPNTNEYNYADLSTVSSATSAIYTMNSSMDSEVFSSYSDASKDYLGKEGKDSKFFEDKVKRTIYVTVDKNGTATDADGNNIDLVDVMVSIKYELLSSAHSYVAPVDRIIKKVEKCTIYTNASSKMEMQSVYVMYYPLYKANSKNDIIIVDNSKDVDFNLYIVAQDTLNHKTLWNNYTDKNVLDLVIYETTMKSSTEANIKLRTNVYKGEVKKSKKDTNTVQLKCNLGYYLGIHKNSEGDAACNIMQAAALDGRLLNTDGLKNKIYSVRIDIYNASGESISTIKGSKLE